MRLALLLTLAACLTAAGLDEIGWSGWRPVADGDGLIGVQAEGSRAVAWSSRSFMHSEDGGGRWSDPRWPPAAAAATAPAPIAACAWAAGRLWILLADGRLVDAAGQDGNPLIGGMAISRLAVDQGGALYLERGDGQRTVVVRDGAVVAEAPGRLASIHAGHAVVRSGAKLWTLAATGLEALPPLRPPPEPGGWPLQSGPGGAVWRDRTGIGWQVRRGQFAASGTLEETAVTSQGWWGWNGQGVALIRWRGQAMIVAGRPEDLLRPGPWDEGRPAEIVAVAGIAQDPQWPTRARLIAVGPAGINLWRSR